MDSAGEAIRTYGGAPFTVAVVHGGPGAPGEMAPVARELASAWGVLEPLQTAMSLDGQVEELKIVLEKNGDPPLTLIGHSWGAWLSFLVAGRYPTLVKKLILVGSGGFEERYTVGMDATRLSRLSEAERAEIESLIQVLGGPAGAGRSAAFARFGALFAKADAYDPIQRASEVLDYQGDVYQSVWPDAARLRRTGELLDYGRHIQCPVLAIHGDYDSHPARGVREPLSTILRDFRFVLLENCGHTPWLERQAREEFYRILREELRSGQARVLR